MSQGFRDFVPPWKVDQIMGGDLASAGVYAPFRVGEYLPGPGPDFVSAVDAMQIADAEAATRRLNGLYYQAAYNDTFELPVRFKLTRKSVPFVTGGRWNWPAQGPIRRHRVMVVGKHPVTEDISARKNLVGPTGIELRRILTELGVDWTDWYVTNVVRHSHLSPAGGGLEANWVKNCIPLLMHELQQVRPDFVLLLGGEAVKALLGGRGKAGVTFAQARMQATDLEIPLPDGTVHVAKACACYHPSFTLKAPEKTPELIADLRKFAKFLKGDKFETIDTNVSHVLVTRHSELKNLVDFILTLPPAQRDMIAVDAEWQGDYPSEPGAYVRTVQFSWASRCAAIVRLHSAGGQPAFEGGIEAAVHELKRLMKTTDDRHVRIVGHFLNADMPWLLSLGLDIRREFEVAAWPDGEYLPGAQPAWEMTRHFGGIDTIVAAHSCEETQELKLEALGSSLLGVHRYDKKLQAWKKEELKKKNLKNDELEGYGDCPDEILEGEPIGELTLFGQPVKDSYGGFDADVTRRLADYYNGVGGGPGALDHDRFGNSSREAFWRTMWAYPAFGECHMVGIGVNTQAADDLANHYRTSADLLLAEFRARTHWPEFNVNSSIHKVEFLFGEEYTSKKNKLTGEPIRTRPEQDNDREEGVCLRLQPYKTTGKRAKLWNKVTSRQQQDYYSVSADKEVISVLADGQPLVGLLRDILKLAQLSKTVLRPETSLTVKKKVKTKLPYTEENQEKYKNLYKKKCPCMLGTVELETPCKCGIRTIEVEVPNPKVRRVHVLDDDEGHGYDGGIFRWIQSDGRVRSQFFPIKETGRASSARPALQNWSKSLEEAYKRIFKEELYRVILQGREYSLPMRSILQARPGYVLVDCDYTGAELAIAAWMSGDPTMIEHVRRNNLDESDPDYFDIHSSVAVRAFRLTVPAGQLTDEKLAKKLKVKLGSSYAEVLKAEVGAPLPFSKFALALIGQVALRVAAKRVIFGKLYGQQAESMARKIREEGVEITVEQAAVIDRAIDDQYPLCARYFGDAAARPGQFGFLQTCFGRHRRFMPTIDEQIAAAQSREAMNFPMQGSVADAMQTAMGHLYRYRRENGMEDAYTINLQVHDAIVLEVAVEHLDRVVDEVLPVCMSDRVTIWPTDHSGKRKPGGPFHLKAPPADVFERWSVPLNPADCERLGISSRYATSA